MPTPQETFDIVTNTLTQEAIKAGMDQSQLPAFLRYALAIANTESSFNPTAHNYNPATRDDSWGVWQINRHPQANPNVPIELATDPYRATLWRAPALIQVWNSLTRGGAAVPAGDDVGFLQRFHQTVQSSAPIPYQTASASLGLVNSAFSGKQYAGQALAQFDPTGRGPGVSGAPKAGAAPEAFPTGPDGSPLPATTFEGLSSAIMNRVARGFNSTDPNEREAAIRLLDSIPQLREAFGSADPNTVFQVGAQLGIKREEIEAARNEANADRAFQADQKSLDRAQALAIKTGDWNIAGQQLAEDRRQHEQQYGISLADLGIRNRALDHQIDQDAAQLGITKDELALRRELGMGDLDIRRQSLAQEGELGRGNLDVSRGNLALQGELGRGNLAISQGTLGLNTELGRGRLALDTEAQQQANALARETLDFNKQQAIISGARSDRQAAMAGLTDLLGTQVRAGEMSSGTAQHALDALLKTWQEAPSTSGYLEGWEPGGINSVLLMRNGGSYDPNNYRVRPFPIDLNSLVNAGSKFDLSQAWQNAVSLMRGEGMMPSQMGNQPFPGASSPGGVPSPTGGATPTMPSTAIPGGTTTLPPTAAPTTPPTTAAPTAPQPSTVGQPSNALPGAPAATPPSTPTTQPQTHWAWDGSKWTQVPNAA